MKKLFVVMIAGLFVIGLTGSAIAQTHDVDVTVASVQVIAVGADVAINLVAPAAGSDFASAGGASTISWSHNQAAAQKITVACSDDVANGANDIDLDVNYNGGSDVEIATNGVGQAAQDLVTGLARGVGSGVALNYSAIATLAVTSAGTFNFDVTYTLTN